jgi:amino acid transporter
MRGHQKRRFKASPVRAIICGNFRQMGLYSRIKRVLVGQPIASKHAHHERLPKVFGLPVFASDALSSVAYASEEILLVLMLAGTAAFALLFPISLALVALLWIVIFSYYQTIHAYPQGGGAYRVASENISSQAGRLAGAALLVGYILTVAVSVSAGASAIISMIPELQPHATWIASTGVLILALLNLRGARESGMVFAIPTYSFVAAILAMVALGIWRGTVEGAPTPKPVLPADLQISLLIGPILVIRAFAAGCTALTGTEAIADGTQAFRAPEAKNAGQTLVLMGVLLTLLVLGISWCAQRFGIVPMDFHEEGYRTVVAQIAMTLVGQGHPFFFVILTITAIILFLAANTGFADFPRLSQFIARDGFLPRQLASVGDRLVFQNGILLLAVLSIALIIMFRADTHSLIPLYAAGVFLSFTLSQAGMFMRWVRTGTRSWKMFVSLFGAITTASVTVILLVMRFTEGAYLLLIALAVIMVVMWRIRRHYDYLAQELGPAESDAIQPMRTVVLLLVPRLHRGILHAISYATSLTDDVRALHVTLDAKGAQAVKGEWNRFGIDLPLVILESPYRSLVEPVIDYIDQIVEEEPDMMITVIVPQAIPKKLWHNILHNNAAVPLKMALQSRPNVVITNVRYFLR